MSKKTENTTSVPERKKVTLVSGAEFWDFNENPEFIGRYVQHKYKDDGELLGYVFEGAIGTHWLIGNSHSIEKALNAELGQKAIDEGLEFELIFKGKIELSNGRSFNKFDVSVYA